jgi:PTS system beta-glucosides-specific IIC component
MNVVHALIACAIGFVVTFVLTWFYGFEEPVDTLDQAETKETEAVKKESFMKKIVITSPVKGKKVNISKINDETFAKEIIGKGIAVESVDGRVVAPFDGTVATVFRTKHVIGLRSEEGVELLIHIGIDTVELEGKFFTSHVQDGDTIKKGDLLLEFDKKAIEEAGYETIIPVLVTNTSAYLEIVASEEGYVEIGETLLTIL